MNDLDDIKFEFDHSELSLVLLHNLGIRTTMDLESVILDGVWYNISDEVYPELYFTVSISSTSRALCVVFSINSESCIIKTFNANLATLEQVKKYFCGGE